MRRSILIFVVFCLLLMGTVLFAHAGGRDSSTGIWPTNTQPVALVDPDGNYAGISNQGANGLLTVSVDYPHHEIHEGNHYLVVRNDTLGSGAKIQMIINTPDTGFVHFLCLHRSSGEANIELWRSPTVSALGTALTVSNNNDLFGDNSGVEFTHTPTISNAGTPLPGHYDHFGQGQTTGGASRGDSEVVLRQSTLYLINATSEAASNDVTVKGSFYIDSGDAP